MYGKALVVDISRRVRAVPQGDRCRRSHRIVEYGLDCLCATCSTGEHRALGGEVNTGDGAGILVQMPDTFVRTLGIDLPRAGDYATGIGSPPHRRGRRPAAAKAIDKLVVSEDLEVLGWREVPTDPSMLGNVSRGPCRVSTRSSSVEGTVAPGHQP